MIFYVANNFRCAYKNGIIHYTKNLIASLTLSNDIIIYGEISFLDAIYFRYNFSKNNTEEKNPIVKKNKFLVYLI